MVNPKVYITCIRMLSMVKSQKTAKIVTLHNIIVDEADKETLLYALYNFTNLSSITQEERIIGTKYIAKLEESEGKTYTL